MIDLHERVAALEARMEASEDTATKILSHVKSIDDNMSRYKGFFGAVWFALSCIGVFFSAFKYFHKG
jgi:hypothetical protein